jgi:hypothetical protein
MLGCIQPMSSPIMKRMFGFFSSCAIACGANAVMGSNVTAAANRITRFKCETETDIPTLRLN